MKYKIVIEMMLQISKSTIKLNKLYKISRVDLGTVSNNKTINQIKYPMYNI